MLHARAYAMHASWRQCFRCTHSRLGVRLARRAAAAAPARPLIAPYSRLDCPSNLLCSDLQGKGLVGQLPLEEDTWVPLATVTKLNLADNWISGILSPAMGVMEGLEYLSLANNTMSSERCARCCRCVCCLHSAAAVCVWHAFAAAGVGVYVWWRERG